MRKEILKIGFINCSEKKFINSGMGEMFNMTKKRTEAQQSIELTGVYYGVSYDDKTYKNIVDILESYRMITFNKAMFDYTITGSESLEELLPYFYRRLIKDEPIGKECVTRLIRQMLNDKKTMKILNDTLEGIKGYSSSSDDKGNDQLGLLYYDILDRLFFKELKPVKTRIYIDLDLESHVFSYRMEEAIMLFGIYFWQRCLSLWEGWREKEKLIQIEEGREDLIH